VWCYRLPLYPGFSGFLRLSPVFLDAFGFEGLEDGLISPVFLSAFGFEGAKDGFLRLCIFYERSDFSGISVMIRILPKFFSHTQV